MSVGVNTVTATIAAAGTLSGAVQLNGTSLLQVLMPAGWDAAALSFQTCETEDGTFADLYDSFGTEVTLAVAAGRSVLVPDDMLRGVNFVKLRSGTSGATVAQTADRAITLLTA
jgi:hypothetical protein